jgi:PAS domain S-box-containing protein
MKTWINRFSFKRLSIQQRLPLLICALLLTTVTIYGLANYYSLKKAVLAIGSERLSSITDQLSSMLGQSTQVLINSGNATAAQSTVIACLKSNGKGFRKEALETLDKLHRDSNWVAVTLINADFLPVLRADNSKGEVKINLKDVIKYNPVGPNSTLIGRMFAVNGVMYYPIITSVSEKKQIIGYIIELIHLNATRQAVTQLSKLVGTGAGFYLTNTDQSFWTDMVKPVAKPPIKASQMGKVMEYTNAGGRRMMGSAKNVAGSDWLVMVEFPEDAVLAGVRTFLRWILAIGLVLTAAGIFAAWVMSRKITKPMNQLTAAATAISQGNYLTPVSVSGYRDDELGKLANAFNVMQVQVYQTWQALEEKVIERTSELQEEIKLRKATEESLRVSSQRYHQLVEEVKDYAIIMLDANGKVLVWNKGAEKIKGYKEDEILGKSFTCFYTKEAIKAGKPQKILDTAARDGRSEDEGWRVRKDGSKFWANVIFTAIYDAENKLSGFAKITRDITERKKLEEERRLISEKLEERVKEVAIQSLQLEAVNKELEAFSYSVSHDLRTPLRAISGYSNMLKEDYETELDAEGKRIVRNIMSNAKMMGQLIDDLLAFSRLGKKELMRTKVDMQSLASAIVNELLSHEPENKYNIRIGLLPPAEADPVMIKQAIMNLIGNAIKYSSKKADPEIEIGHKDGGTNTIYFIKDNGAGFDMAYADKLFGVFQRLHSQEEFEGTGVGLALVKRIIDKHKGEIWAEGQENVGATFYFSLPKKLNI